MATSPDVGVRWKHAAVAADAVVLDGNPLKSEPWPKGHHAAIRQRPWRRDDAQAVRSSAAASGAWVCLMKIRADQMPIS
jgi:hypothetical protein